MIGQHSPVSLITALVAPPAGSEAGLGGCVTLLIIVAAAGTAMLRSGRFKLGIHDRQAPVGR